MIVSKTTHYTLEPGIRPELRLRSNGRHQSTRQPDSRWPLPIRIAFITALTVGAWIAVGIGVLLGLAVMP